MKNLIQALMERMRRPQQSESHSSVGGSELTEEQVLVALTEPSRIAFKNLRNAADIQGHPGYVWARRSDVDRLLTETIVSVGIEVDLLAARDIIVQIDELVYNRLDDHDRLVEEVQKILNNFFRS